VTEDQAINENLSSKEQPRPRRNYPWAMIIVAALFVGAAFFSWWGSWFGRKLSDTQMTQYLHDAEKPRNVQHALYQISERIQNGDQSVKKWYSDVVAASQHKAPEVRLLAAWVMGQDTSYDEFHSALAPLLADPIPSVRHNAALALVRFKDPAARAELAAMLKPIALKAESGGTIELIVKQDGVAVPAGAPLVRIKQPGGQVVEVRAPEEARVDFVSATDGATVEEGAELITLSPSVNQVWETLRALYCIGETDDIPYIERYTRPLPGMAEDIQKQAARTIEAIKSGSVRCL